MINSYSKINILLLVVFSLFVCLLFPEYDINAANDITIGKEYSRILDNYYEAYKDAKIGDGDFNMMIVNNNFYIDAQPTVHDGQPDFCYKVMDCNNDGTPELYILLRYDKDKGEVYDAYTFLNGKAKRIVDEGIGYRAGTCSFCKNEIVESITIGGFDYTVIKFQRYSSKKNMYSTFLTISDIHGTCSVKEDGRTSIISKQKYNRIQKKYEKKRKTRFYLYSEKAKKCLIKGEFTFDGQKNWNLFT